MAHDLKVMVRTFSGTYEVDGYAAAMIVGITAIAAAINARNQGEITLNFGRRHGVRITDRRELARVPITVEAHGEEATV